MKRRSVHALLLVLFSLYLASCSGDHGPQRIAVHGTVRFDDAPLYHGQIRFVPTAGTAGPAAAATIENGEYVFTAENGPVIGTHRVEIAAENFYEFEVDDERGFAKFAASGEIRDRTRTENPVPPRFNTSSSLTRSVDADTEPRFDFDLDRD